MTYLVAVVLSAVFGACVCLNTWELPVDDMLGALDSDLELDWMIYKKSFNKTYDTVKEELKRRIFWQDNVYFIRHHNAKFAAGETTFEVGENDMADMAEDEMQKTYLSGLIIPEERDDAPVYPENPDAEDKDVPLEMDWRDSKDNRVTPVKNQGRCGSCWTFSAVGALEGLHKKKTGQLLDLSEQNLLDCSIRGNHGCRGGWMNNAFKYVKRNGGINTERCYPYRYTRQYCNYNRRRGCKGATIRGYSSVQKSATSLRMAVAKEGPISIATDANHRTFMMYRGGVFYEPRCSPQANPSHAMTLVGYGNSRYGAYWIVKNSWGARWGDRGYVKMARNKGRNCRITDFASFPQ